MNQGLGSQAYTIVEVMIVLAISSLLLVSALTLIGGSQQKNEFTQSIHDIQSQIGTTINNVSTGFYAEGSTGFICKASVSGPIFVTNGSIDRGTNQDCIFVGRAMQFAVADVGTDFNIYNLVGLQLDPTTTLPVTSLDAAKPVALSKGALTNNYAAVPETTEIHTLGYGLEAKKMSYIDASGNPQSTSVVAFVTDFPSSSAGSLASSSRDVDLYAIQHTGIGLGIAQTDAVDAINAKAPLTNIPTNFAVASSVSICFEGGVNQNGTITIGGNNTQLNTTLVIGAGPC